MEFQGSNQSILITEKAIMHSLESPKDRLHKGTVMECSQLKDISLQTAELRRMEFRIDPTKDPGRRAALTGFQTTYPDTFPSTMLTMILKTPDILSQLCHEFLLAVESFQKRYAEVGWNTC